MVCSATVGTCALVRPMWLVTLASSRLGASLLQPQDGGIAPDCMRLQGASHEDWVAMPALGATCCSRLSA